MDFFCFGTIFESGISTDPYYTLAAGATLAPPIPLDVCGENSLTAMPPRYLRRSSAAATTVPTSASVRVTVSASRPNTATALPKNAPT